MGIKFSPRKIASVMLMIILILFILHVGSQVLHFGLGYDSHLLNGFDFGRERNVPTYYASFSLFFCGALLAAVGVFSRENKAKGTRFWGVLSAIFVYLSMDEILEIHEKLIGPVRTILHTKGIFFLAWVIPYGLLLIIFLLVFSGFLIALPTKTRTLFITSGAVYVLGAVGMEMLGSLFHYRHGGDNFGYKMYQTVEELLEMFGVVIFAYALADYIKVEMKSLTLEFEEHADSSSH